MQNAFREASKSFIKACTEAWNLEESTSILGLIAIRTVSNKIDQTVDPDLLVDKSSFVLFLTFVSICCVIFFSSK